MSYLTDNADNKKLKSANDGKSVITANGVVPVKTNPDPPSGNNTTGGSSPYNAPQNFTSDYDGGYDDYDDYRSDYRDEYLDIQRKYDAALAAQQAAIKAGVARAQGDINAQKDATAQNYADMYKQLYINKMNSQKGIDQQLAAMGQTGGQAESTLLGLQTNYADSLRQGKMGEANAIKDLNKAYTDAGLAGDIESANAIASNALNSANAYANAYQFLIAQDEAANQNRIAMANERASTDRQYAYNIAMALLNNGQMPDDATLFGAGINKNDALAIVAGNKKTSTSPLGKTSNAYDIIKENAITYANNMGKSTALSYLKEKFGADNPEINGQQYTDLYNLIKSMF